MTIELWSWWRARNNAIRRVVCINVRDARLVTVGVNGSVCWHRACGKLNRDFETDIDLVEHLPDCTGFDWVPEEKKRTVVMRRWIIWDKPGHETESWSTSEPLWKVHRYDTGETKEVEVPL